MSRDLTMKKDKITIVGGGTAGWLAALVISRRNPLYDVTVVSSEKIGVIGVGESTTGFFTNVVCNEFFDLDCDINEFISETGATLKYSIKHKGWTKDKNQHYHGPIDGWGFSENTEDIFLKYALAYETDQDELLSISQMGSYISTGKSNFNNGHFTDVSHAMHIDAHLAGQYFRKKCLQKDNVVHFDTEVINVNLDEKGYISSIDCADGKNIKSDIFIDCTGFKRLLLNKLGAKWHSYKENLPVKAAIPFHLPYNQNEMPEPYTTATALSAGWMWQIPLMDRKGCGYAFDTDFITPDQAYSEIESKLGTKVDASPLIKFDSGRQEESWIKNCIAIGLSSAFLEPLEATSIHTTLCQIKSLSDEFILSNAKDTLNTGSIELYNKRTRLLFDDTRDFLVMHYMGGRNDTEFWKYISSGNTQTEYVKNLIEMSKYKVPGPNDFPSYFGAAGWGLYSHVMKGLGLLDPAMCRKNIESDFLQIPFTKTLVDHDYRPLKEFIATRSENSLSYNSFIQYFRDKRKN
jgi:tryptophan halogenase